MSDIPIRAFSLNTDLKVDSVLKTQLVQSETKTGLWQICIKDVSNCFDGEYNYLAKLECNLVKDFKINRRTGELQTYNPALCTFNIKGKIHEKKVVQFDKCWFQINAPNSELKLTIKDVETDKTIKINCEIYVTVLMQRIK